MHINTPSMTTVPGVWFSAGSYAQTWFAAPPDKSNRSFKKPHFSDSKNRIFAAT
jgi:hypothetical protein